MAIRVRLQLLNSNDKNGVKLLVIVLDGSNRTWFKWYVNAGIAIFDAENMYLVETPVNISPSASRFAVNIHRRLLAETEIEENVLDTEWHKGPVQDA